MINSEYIEFAAYYGFNPFDPIYGGSGMLPEDHKCCFCREAIDTMQMYMIIMELCTYAHISCVEKAVDNDKS